MKHSASAALVLTMLTAATGAAAQGAPVTSAAGTWKRFDGPAIAGPLAPVFQTDFALCLAEAEKAATTAHPPHVVAGVQQPGRTDPFSSSLRNAQQQAIMSLLNAVGTACMIRRGYHLAPQ